MRIRAATMASIQIFVVGYGNEVLVHETPAISRHFERDPIPYALDTEWPVGAAGFEPLHFGISPRDWSPESGRSLRPQPRDATDVGGSRAGRQTDG